ncbi:alpha/beta hydrolase [Roseibium salinum]|nr:alpha/beta hydrolase [Roseibium salinum]
MPDLPGYGRSSIPLQSADHGAYSKRTMANAMVEMMQVLGHRRFSLAGHDRGGRVAYRLAMDHPEVVERLAILDILPTSDYWDRMDRTFALKIYHWMFLAQPAPFPEKNSSARRPSVSWNTRWRAGLPKKNLNCFFRRGPRPQPRLVLRPRPDRRHMRGLPGGRGDRLRARQGGSRSRQKDRSAPACPVGRQGHCDQRQGSAGRVAELVS